MTASRSDGVLLSLVEHLNKQVKRLEYENVRPPLVSAKQV